MGNGSVGKTAMTNRYCIQKFNENIKATVGLDFGQNNYKYGNAMYDVLVWDTAGSERYGCVADNYYKRAHAAILVYSVTDQDSLD